MHSQFRGTEDLIIPSRSVLTDEAMAQVAKRLAEGDQPTEVLRLLFRG